MKKKKGFSMILLIPAIVLVLAIAGVFTYKLYSEGVRAKASETPVNKTVPPLQTAERKPSKGYGKVQGPGSPTGQTGTGSAQIDLETLVNETDDGGEADLQTLDAEAQQL